MIEVIKKNKELIIIGIFLIVLIILGIVVEDYQYNKCLKVNEENLKECKRGDYLEEDCYQFENAEEYCRYYVDYK